MATLRDSINFNSPVPYYSQLKEILLEQINRGIWRIGDNLPSHSALCEKYGVSKVVVRQALKELEYEGRVIQRKGKVATIAGPKISGHLLERLAGTYQDMAELGYYPISQVIKQHVIQANDEIAQRLTIEPGTEVIEIERLRFVGEEPFELITSYLPYAMCPKIKEVDLTKKSLLGVLEEEYGIVITSSRRSIETIGAKDYDAKLLKVKKGAPLLLYNSISYMGNGNAIGTTRALFRGDRARFEVELVTLKTKD